MDSRSPEEKGLTTRTLNQTARVALEANLEFYRTEVVVYEGSVRKAQDRLHENEKYLANLRSKIRDLEEALGIDQRQDSEGD